MSSSSVSGSTFDSAKYSVITSIKAWLSAVPRLRRRAISSEEDMAQDQRSEERSGYETSGYRENVCSCVYGVRVLSNAVYYNNCIPPFLFAVYAGVGKLFLAVELRSYVLRRPKYPEAEKRISHDFIGKCRFVHYLEISFTDLWYLLAYTVTYIKRSISGENLARFCRSCHIFVVYICNIYALVVCMWYTCASY